MVAGGAGGRDAAGIRRHRTDHQTHKGLRGLGASKGGDIEDTAGSKEAQLAAIQSPLKLKMYGGWGKGKSTTEYTRVHPIIK